MASIEKRISNEGLVHYRVKVRLKGFPIQTATFDRLTDAKKWSQQIEVAIREGRYFKTTESRKHTLGDLITRYKETVLANSPRKQKDQAVQFQWWKDSLGAFVLADVTPQLIARYRDKLSLEKTRYDIKRSGATVNRYLAALSHAFTVAIKEWGWLETNPVQRVMKFKEPRGRVRFLSDDERKNLLIACKESGNPYLYIVVVLCLSTGARKMEILGLRWNDIDLQRNVITLHETKNGERRGLPLTSHALELIQEHYKVRNLKTDLVFPGNTLIAPVELKKVWDEVLVKAEITDFRFHDLRHSAASYLAMNGATVAEIAAVLGHKTLQMVKRYAHLSEAHTAKVVAAMNEKIFKITSK